MVNITTNKPAHLRRIGMALCLLVLACICCTIGASSARAANPEIVNTANNAWLQSLGSTGEAGNSSNKMTVGLLVKRDSGKSITGIRIDEDYNGTDNSSTATLRAVTPESTSVTINGSIYDYVQYQWTNATTSGYSCSSTFSSSSTDTLGKPLYVRAQDNTGQMSNPVSATVQLNRTSNCSTLLNAKARHYIYNQSQSATEIEPGGSVTFNYNGTKTYSNTGSFSGVLYRLRRASDGFTTSAAQSCNPNSTTVTFPDRGLWIVEANALARELAYIDGVSTDCVNNGTSGTWFRLGAVKVNSAAANGPTANLTVSRPVIDGNAVADASSAADAADAASGGAVQNVEWDLDEDTSNGLGGFENAANGAPNLAPGDLTRTISTVGQAPGLHNVRVRLTDNGAINAADSTHRQNTFTRPYLVDTPPVAYSQSQSLDSDDTLPVTLAGTDIDLYPGLGINDEANLGFSIVDAPDHGTLSTLSGTRGNETVYDPADNYSGNDSFTYKVDDGYGGTDTETVSLRVDPPTYLDEVPDPGIDHNTRAAGFEFSSPVESGAGATLDHYECSLDGGAWSTCTSPLDLQDLSDGSHNMRIRAFGGDGTVDLSPAETDWVVDATPSVSFTATPTPDSGDDNPIFEFTAASAGSSTAPAITCKLDNGNRRPCSSPLALTDLADGDHSLTVFATDGYGREAKVTYQWEIAKNGVHTWISSETSLFSGSADQEFTFETDVPSNTFECLVDSNDWDADGFTCSSPYGLTGLDDGNHSFSVRAVNINGIADATPATWAWTVDTVAPDTGIQDWNAPITKDQVTAKFSSDEDDVTYLCSVDGGDFGPCDSPYTGPSGLAEGSHQIEVAAEDQAGNVDASPAEESWVLDTVAPTSTLDDGPDDGSLLNTDEAEFDFTIDDATTTPSAQCKMDDQSWRDCDSSSEQDYSGLSEGDHTFRLRAVDEAGNVQSPVIERSWSIDTVAPVVSVISAPSGTVASRNAELKFAVSETATTDCKVDNNTWQSCASPLSLSDLADGTHKVSISATDQAGNDSVAPVSRSWKVKVTTPRDPNTPPEGDPCQFNSDDELCVTPDLSGSLTGKPKKKGKVGLTVALNSPTTALGSANISLGRNSLIQLTKKLRKRPVVTVAINTPATGAISYKLTAKRAAKRGKIKLNGLPAGALGSIRLGRSPALALSGLPAGTNQVIVRVGAQRHQIVPAKGKVVPSQKWTAVATDDGGHVATALVYVDPPKAKAKRRSKR